eukprot:CAMPEP_0183719448 /NCGR_PEP_ID=MMETSP0737-20130205/12381_1 /TAXON_ID=385413 /ORGANISM="Thalassiosira miniscula, Strain CCMP1093" /LENGTH=920 /DNA_ID=CAMNT_0025949167 /DNA_START=269 /DNA_END=3028 /DNA_ORIENTATION=-
MPIMDGDGDGEEDEANGGWDETMEMRGMRRRRRRLDDYNDDDDYIEYMENRILPTMQSPSCQSATSNYAQFTFPHLVLLYLFGMSLYAAVSLYYERSIFQLSSLGTPTRNLELRSPLRGMIEFKMTYLAASNAVLLVYAMMISYTFMSGLFTKCFGTVWWIIWFVLLLTQAIQCLFVVTTLASLWRVKPIIAAGSSQSPSTTTTEMEGNSDFYQRHVDHLHSHNNAQIAEEMWASRCEGCCRILAVSTCFLFGGKGIVSYASEGGGEKFYGDISRVLADYFADFGDGSYDCDAVDGGAEDGGGGTNIGDASDYSMRGGGGGGTIRRGLDVVPSDVGLGFVMLRHMQAQRKMLAQRDALLQTTTRYGSRPGSEVDLSTMRENAGTNNGSVNGSSAMDTSQRQLSPNRTALLFRWSSPSTRPISQSSLNGGAILDPCNITNDSPTNNNNHHHPQPLSPPEEAYRSFSRTVLSPTNPEDYALMEEGARFARHQLAIYTWILYYYQFPVTGTLRLIGQSLKTKLLQCNNHNNNSTAIADRTSRRSNPYDPVLPDIEGGLVTDDANGDTHAPSDQQQPPLHPNNETIVGDNFLHIHEATMLAHANLTKSDIAYASFEAGFYETPYCIIIDRKWKSIVVSIRGSLTLEDCVVDVLLDPSPLDGLGEKYGFNGAGQYCHGGVVECANWLHDDLMRHKILQGLLLGDTAQYPGYSLRIVGHSLGAGIGVILSLMLRNTYPALRCLCYSPPGGLLTWELARECSEFVNSFVLDSDIVPRLSVNNMERLRDEVLHLIARVKLSKYEIAQRIFWHGVCGDVELGDLDFLIQQNEDMLYAPDNVPDSDFKRQLQRFEMIQQERRSSRGLARSISLYPPGRITHLVKTGQTKNCLHGLAGCITCGASNAGAEYTPIQKENDDFNEIEISPTLW